MLQGLEAQACVSLRLSISGSTPAAVVVSAKESKACTGCSSSDSARGFLLSASLLSSRSAGSCVVGPSASLAEQGSRKPAESSRTSGRWRPDMAHCYMTNRGMHVRRRRERLAIRQANANVRRVARPSQSCCCTREQEREREERRRRCSCIPLSLLPTCLPSAQQVLVLPPPEAESTPIPLSLSCSHTHTRTWSHDESTFTPAFLPLTPALASLPHSCSSHSLLACLHSLVSLACSRVKRQDVCLVSSNQEEGRHLVRQHLQPRHVHRSRDASLAWHRECHHD